MIPNGNALRSFPYIGATRVLGGGPVRVKDSSLVILAIEDDGVYTVCEPMLPCTDDETLRCSLTMQHTGTQL